MSRVQAKSILGRWVNRPKQRSITTRYRIHPPAHVALVNELMKREGLQSIKQAEHLIRYGRVVVNDRVVRDPTWIILPQAQIYIDSPVYVSRAGYKLQSAFDFFTAPLLKRGSEEAVALDVGSRAGGFTQCLLHNGFARVHAVEIAPGQMHPAIQSDPRVTLHEGVDIRTLDPQKFTLRAQLIVADLAGIPLLPILPRLGSFLEPNGLILAMVKPAAEFPGLPELLNFLHEQRLKGHQIGQRMSPDFSPQELARLGRRISSVGYKRRRVVLTAEPTTLRKNFYRFAVGARVFGFRCLGRIVSPIPVDRGRWEEFFLLQPVDNRYYR